MTTSGSINFTQTRTQIIQAAFSKIGVYGVGRTVSAEDMAIAVVALNSLVKTYQAQGLHLWSKEEGYLFIADNTGTYTLSADSTSARATTRSDAVITQLSVAGSASDTALTVDSTTGMAASDIIGIVNDDDVVTWDTIASVDTSTTLTLTTGLDGACAIDNNVYTFTSRINKPMRILGMRRVIDGPSTPSSIPMMPLSQQEYFDLPNKNSNGNPTHFYYNPQLTTGNLYLWPRPDDPQMYFELTFERQLEDFDAAGNTPDFPSEWVECLIYQLAVRLAHDFGKESKLATLQPLAESILNTVLNYDTEITSIQLVPEYPY